MSAELPFFKFWAVDWLGDFKTRTMSAEERGIYIDLLAFDWVEDGIPDDPKLLARAVGVDAERMRIAWATLAPRFRPHPTHEGRVTNHRLRKEREEIESAQEKRSRAASKAAKARWAQEKQRDSTPEDVDAPRNASAMRSASDSHDTRGRARSQSQSQRLEEGAIQPHSSPHDPGGRREVKQKVEELGLDFGETRAVLIEQCLLGEDEAGGIGVGLLLEQFLELVERYDESPDDVLAAVTHARSVLGDNGEEGFIPHGAPFSLRVFLAEEHGASNLQRCLGAHYKAA